MQELQVWPQKMRVAGFVAEIEAECQGDSWSLAKIVNNYRRNCKVEGGS